MATSPARILANRANAARSTGPRTETGKDASRRNALKHGLAARTLPPPDAEPEALERRAAAWRADLRPEGAVADWLVETAAADSLRAERCEAREAALRIEEARRAAESWEEDRRLEAEALAVTLPRRPAIVALRLRETKQGADWLRERWQALGEALEARGTWTEDERARVLDLMGVPAGERPAAGDDLDPEGWKELVAAEVRELERLGADVLDDRDARERLDAERGLPHSESKAVALVRRYAAAALRRVRWALDRLRPARGAGRVGLAPAPARVDRTPAAPPPAVVPEAGPSSRPNEPNGPAARPLALALGAAIAPLNRRERRAQRALARR